MYAGLLLPHDGDKDDIILPCSQLEKYQFNIYLVIIYMEVKEGGLIIK